MGKYRILILFGFSGEFWSVYANGSTHGVDKNVKYIGTGGYRSYKTPIIYSDGFKNAYDDSEGFASFNLNFRTYSQEDWSVINDSLIETGNGWFIEDDNGTWFMVFPDSIEYTPIGTYKNPWKHDWSMSGIGRRQN